VTIIKATHWELDSKRKVEFFATGEIAHQYTDRWLVTDRGHITFEEIQAVDA
jgi:hypothetical protein